MICKKFETLRGANWLRCEKSFPFHWSHPCNFRTSAISQRWKKFLFSYECLIGCPKSQKLFLLLKTHTRTEITLSCPKFSYSILCTHHYWFENNETNKQLEHYLSVDCNAIYPSMSSPRTCISTLFFLLLLLLLLPQTAQWIISHVMWLEFYILLLPLNEPSHFCNKIWQLWRLGLTKSERHILQTLFFLP